MDAPTKTLFPDRIAVTGSDGFIFTALAGSFQPNALGIYADMHGNVGMDRRLVRTSSHNVAGGSARTGGGKRTGRARGGDWYHDRSFARSAQRYPIFPDSAGVMRDFVWSVKCPRDGFLQIRIRNIMSNRSCLMNPIRTGDQMTARSRSRREFLAASAALSSGALLPVRGREADPGRAGARRAHV